jgi:hypothetical protein
MPEQKGAANGLIPVRDDGEGPELAKVSAVFSLASGRTMAQARQSRPTSASRRLEPERLLALAGLRQPAPAAEDGQQREGLRRAADLDGSASR